MTSAERLRQAELQNELGKRTKQPKPENVASTSVQHGTATVTEAKATEAGPNAPFVQKHRYIFSTMMIAKYSLFPLF